MSKKKKKKGSLFRKKKKKETPKSPPPTNVPPPSFEQLFSGNTNPQKMNEEKYQEVLTQLKNENDNMKLCGLNELVTFLSISLEPPGFIQYKDLTSLLLKIAEKSELPLVQVLSMRCLTNLIELIPKSGKVYIEKGGLLTIKSKLMNLSYIDVTEQAIYCLDKLAKEYGHLLLKDDLHGSMLDFIDFHNMAMQRKILQICGNICRKVNKLEEVEKILQRLFQFFSNYSDQLIIQYALQVFSNIVFCLQKEDVLERIFTSDKVRSLVNLLRSENANSKSKSYLYSLFTVCCNYSLKIIELLYANGIVEFVDSVINDKDELFYEICQMMFVLLPAFHKDHFPLLTGDNSRNVFVEMIKPVKMKSKSASSGRKTPTKKKADIQTRKKTFFEKNQKFLVKFGGTLLGDIFDVFTGSVDYEIRSQLCKMMLSILSYSSPQNLSTIVRDLSICSYVSQLLSENDLMFVSVGLELSAILLQKDRKKYVGEFMKRGVLNELEKISGVKSLHFRGQTLFDKMQVHSNEMYSKTIKKVSIQKSKKEKELLKNLHEYIITFEAKETTYKNSRLKMDVKSLKSRDILLYVIAVCEDIQKKYFSKVLVESKASSQLQKTALELLKYRESNALVNKSPSTRILKEKKLLWEICRLINDKRISNYELLNSGIFTHFVDYLCRKHQKDTFGKNRLKRIIYFEEIFNREIETKNLTKISTPEKRSSRKSFGVGDVERNMTYLENFLIRLNECLTSVEHFRIIVKESYSIVRGIQKALNAMNETFVLSLVPKKGGETMQVHVTPLTKIKEIKVALRNEVRRKRMIRERLEIERIRKLKGEEEKKKKEETEKEEVEEEGENDVFVIDDSDDESDDDDDDEKDNGEGEDEEEEEEKSDDEETKLTKLLREIPRVANQEKTNYFRFSNPDDDDEDFVGSEVTEFPHPKHEDFLSYLKNTKTFQNGNGESSTLNDDDDEVAELEENYLLEFNEIELDDDINIFYALTNYDNIHPTDGSFWDDEKIVIYSAVDENSMMDLGEDELGSPIIAFDLEEKFGISDKKLAYSLNSILDSSYDAIFPNETKETNSILKIIGVISVMNLNIQNVVVQQQHFINKKLTEKINRQLEDPYMLYCNIMPRWCSNMAERCKFLFSFDTRSSFFFLTSLGIARSIRMVLARTSQRRSSTFGRNARIVVKIEEKKLRISRKNLLESAFEIFKHFGRANQTLEFQFYGEAGVGLGPSQEFFTVVSDELKKRILGIWVDDTDENAGDDEIDKDAFVKSEVGLFPKAIDCSIDNEDVKKKCAIFYFIGFFVARAIIEKRLIDIPFSKAMLKLLKGDKLVFHDLEDVNPAVYVQFSKLREICNEKKRILTDGNLTNRQKKIKIEAIGYAPNCKIRDLQVTFILPGYDIPLKPFGGDELVTIHNVEEYVQKSTEYYLNKGIRRQVDALRAGFGNLFSCEKLQLFTEEELDNVFNGIEEDWNIEFLRETVVCDHGYTKSSRVVTYLLKLMSKMSKDEKRTFLLFLTGTRAIPIGGLKNLKPPLTVVRKQVAYGKNLKNDEILPSCMTCSHYLKLPDYSSFEVLKERLFKAIYNTKEFHMS